MKVTAGDGRRWRIGKRRTPWRLSNFWVGRALLGLISFFDDVEVLGWIFAVIFFLPTLLCFMVGWLLGLLLTPFVALFRAMGIAKTVVIAYPAGWIGEFSNEWKLATDADTASQLLTRLPQELTAFNAPRSLPAPK